MRTTRPDDLPDDLPEITTADLIAGPTPVDLATPTSDIGFDVDAIRQAQTEAPAARRYSVTIEGTVTWPYTDGSPAADLSLDEAAEEFRQVVASEVEAMLSFARGVDPRVTIEVLTEELPWKEEK